MPFWIALAAAAAAAQPLAASASFAPATSPCGTARLCNAQVLAPFFARLEESRRGTGRPVHIIQLGDSHTAGDMISNGWRTRLQARYGNGGRGVLAGGRPYRGYLTWGVTAGQTDGWRVNAIFGPSYGAGTAPLGLSGFTQTTDRAGESLTVKPDTGQPGFERLTVCAMTGPGAGGLILRLGQAEANWDLSAPSRRPECRSVENEAPVDEATATTAGEGTVSVTSMATFRRGGVALSNLGVSGSQLMHTAREDPEVVRAEFREYRPDLIVLAFGTNEGFSPTLSPSAYEAYLRQAVARIRRLAGADVPILLLGAPDAATSNRQLAANGAGGPVDCGNGWYVPALLAEVRARQRAVARELGLAFWDWSAAMGGACASTRWQERGLVRGDRVHFTKEGGLEIGGMLFDDLERAAAEDR